MKAIIVNKGLSHLQEDRPNFLAITGTIKRYDFKLIDN